MKKLFNFKWVVLSLVVNISLWLIFLYLPHTPLSSAENIPVAPNMENPNHTICDEAFAFRFNLELGSKRRDIEEKAYQNCLYGLNFEAQLQQNSSSIILPQITLAPLNKLANISRREVNGGKIIEVHIAPLINKLVVISNYWYKKLDNGNELIVYAGVKKSSANTIESSFQTLVIVNTVTPNYEIVIEESGEYSLPGLSEPIRIVDAEANQFTLVTNSGRTFIFDLNKKEFLELTDNLPYKRLVENGWVVETGLVSFPSHDLVIHNHWHKEENGIKIVAMAGAKISNPKQGIIQIQVFSSENSQEPSQEFIYLTPVLYGAVRISDIKNNQLMLTTDAEVQIIFDMTNQEFLSPH